MKAKRALVWTGAVTCKTNHLVVLKSQFGKNKVLEGSELGGMVLASEKTEDQVKRGTYWSGQWKNISSERGPAVGAWHHRGCTREPFSPN